MKVVRRVPWPILNPTDAWAHLRLEPNIARAPASPQAVAEVWSRHPNIVSQWNVDGTVVSELRSWAATFVRFDVARRLCLISTGHQPSANYQRVVSETAGPTAILYGEGDLPDEWRSRRISGGVRFYNTGEGYLRRATIDNHVGLPTQLTTADDEIVITIVSVGFGSPPPPPDVAGWRKEVHNRRFLALSAALESVGAGGPEPLDALEYRSSGMPAAIRLASIATPDVTAKVALMSPGMSPDGLVSRVGVGDRIGTITGDANLGSAALESLGAMADEQDSTESADDWERRVDALVAGLSD